MVYIASPLVNYYQRAASNILYLGIAKEVYHTDIFDQRSCKAQKAIMQID